MKKIIVILTAFTFLVSGCRRNIDKPEINAFGFTTIEDAEKNLGNFAKAFYVVDGSIYTRFEQNGVGSTFSSNGFVDGWFTGGSGLERTNGGTFTIDNIEYYFDKTANGYVAKGFENDLDHSLMTSAVKKMYGKQVNAKLVREGKEIFSSSYYSPLILNANTSNQILDGSSFHQIDEKNGLNLTWDKDLDNKDGVVIHIFWSGDKLDIPFSAQGTAGNKEFATKIDDTGSINLPYSFFSKLPKNAIFSVNIFRGKIDIITGTDNHAYKVYNLAEHKMKCAII
jgi:hypothetical protein